MFIQEFISDIRELWSVWMSWIETEPYVTLVSEHVKGGRVVEIYNGTCPNCRSNPSSFTKLEQNTASFIVKVEVTSSLPWWISP